MKRETSYNTSMTLQNSFQPDRETVSILLPEEFIKKAKDIQSYDEQTKSLKPCSETNEFEHHQQAVESKSTKKEATLQSQDDAEGRLHLSSAVQNRRTTNEADGSGEDNGRERLKRHRVEVAGRVWIPDIWGQEELLKDWTDCMAFDASIMNTSLLSARAALVEEGRRAHSSRLSIEKSC